MGEEPGFRDYIPFVAGIIIIAVLVGLIVSGAVRIAIVDGRSMEPLLHTGDVVFLEKKPVDQIRVGDIVVYKSFNGRYIIHRVIKIFRVNNNYCFIVKGDNNPIPDPGFPSCNSVGIPSKVIIGVVIQYDNTTIKIPYIGGFSVALRGGEK